LRPGCGACAQWPKGVTRPWCRLQPRFPGRVSETALAVTRGPMPTATGGSAAADRGLGATHHRRGRRLPRRTVPHTSSLAVAHRPSQDSSMGGTRHCLVFLVLCSKPGPFFGTDGLCPIDPATMGRPPHTAAGPPWQPVLASAGRASPPPHAPRCHGDRTRTRGARPHRCGGHLSPPLGGGLARRGGGDAGEGAQGAGTGGQGPRRRGAGRHPHVVARRAGMRRPAVSSRRPKCLVMCLGGRRARPGVPLCHRGGGGRGRPCQERAARPAASVACVPRWAPWQVGATQQTGTGPFIIILTSSLPSVYPSHQATTASSTTTSTTRHQPPLLHPYPSAPITLTARDTPNRLYSTFLFACSPAPPRPQQ